MANLKLLIEGIEQGTKTITETDLKMILGGI